MSRLARALILGVVLMVLSLGSTAHAQDGDAPSQQAAVTQQSPTQAAGLRLTPCPTSGF